MLLRCGNKLLRCGSKLLRLEPAEITPVKYGLLYNWYAATDARNIAPAGWNIPSYSEWNLLSLIGIGSGGKLKETGTTYWDSPNTGATNEVGFNARGTGVRGLTGGFFYLNAYGYWWQIPVNVSGSNYLILEYNSASTLVWIGDGGTNYKKIGRAIRYIKDDSNDPETVTGNDGKIYPTVKIGDQVWTACNVAETKYRNGDAIPEVTDNAAWAALTTGALCAYDNDWNNV